jgi:peptidoglycan/xylan/chitin deacetylase (PgdA/CDA1 family)
MLQSVAYAAVKLRLARALGRTGLAPVLLAAQRWTASPFIKVLGYHSARKDDAAGAQYDEGVVDLTPEGFERKLDFLARSCSVITLDELRGFVSSRGARRLPPNPVLLTFDDGYLDNHDVLLPALARRGMTAVFFIATSYIEERRLFWWDRVNFLLKTSTKERLELTYPERMSLPLRPAAARAATIRTVLRIIKDRFGLDLERFLAHLAEAADVSLSREDERRRVDALMMTWDHVRALRRAGMDVQSHTTTHRVLQTLTPTDLAFELTTSRAKLGEVLGEPVHAVSYPVGRSLEWEPHIREAVRAAGYELGFSNCTGVNHTWSFDPLNMRRMSTDGASTDTQFQSMIAVPYLGT